MVAGDNTITPRIVSMADIRQDARNARKHNPRNVGQIERSIQRDGFGRSGLLSADNVIAAGNATYEAATAVGMDEAIVVDSDGTRPIYVRRTDLQSGTPEFHEIAVADNRTAELAEWDAEMTQALIDDALIQPEEHWFPGELDRILDPGNLDDFDPNAEWQGMPEYDQSDKMAAKQVIVNFASESDVDQFARLVEQNVTMTTKSIWYPRVAKDDRMARAFVADGSDDGT